MKNLILIIIASFFLTGCSLIPKVNFNTPNTVPQSVDKSKAKEVCKGKAEWNDDGTLKSCSKGYYRYAENYEKQERKMTLSERIKSFINNLVGWGFWGFILLLIICPSLIGVILGRLIEGTMGVAKRALSATVRGVQNARKNGKNLDDALASEQDNDIKKYIRKVKEQEKLK